MGLLAPVGLWAVIGAVHQENHGAWAGLGSFGLGREAQAGTTGNSIGNSIGNILHDPENSFLLKNGLLDILVDL